MLTQFRTYQLSLTLYRSVQTSNLSCHLRDQLLRATSSVCLNLAEGYGRQSTRDRARFYAIAFGSLREVQAIFDLSSFSSEQSDILDKTAASLYKLLQAMK